MRTKFKKPSDIRVRVIGYGSAFHMGREHLKEMRAAGMTPAAVAELDTERLAVATMDYPAIATVVVAIRRHRGDPTVFLQLGQRFADEWHNEKHRVSPRTRQ
jgi:predicted dehydrogenase